MKPLKQSFSWWCFANKGVADADLLVAAKQIGYDAVELMEKPLFPMARDAGLAIASIAGHDGIQNGMNRRENTDRIEKELRGSIETAVEFNIPNLVCFSGNRGELDDTTGMVHCAEILERVVPIAEQAGVTLLMELLNSRVDHKNYQCDHTLWGVELCKRIHSPAVKLLYDIYHMQIMEGDIIRTIRAHHSYFGHYHTAGNPGRGPMDDTQELHYPPIYRTIVEIGYEGYIGHEFLPKGNPVTELSTAFQKCQASVS